MRLGNAAFLLATMCTPAPNAQGTPGASVATAQPPASQPTSEPHEARAASDAAVEPAPTSVCDASSVREQITQALFADQEFRNYVCEEPCSEQAFAGEFLLRQSRLRERPATWGCFAEPKRQATTGLFVVFVVQNGSAHWEMSYTGISIAPKPGHHTRGYVDLEGRERASPATWLTHRFVWNGKGYVLKSTQPSSSH